MSKVDFIPLLLTDESDMTDMATIRYIDPDLKKALDKVNPAIRKETGYSFDIAKRISDLLKAKHWSQADLARATGKKTPMVSRWLSGTHNFTIQTIAEIETAFGQSIITVNKTKRNHIASSYRTKAASRFVYLNDDGGKTQ